MSCLILAEHDNVKLRGETRKVVGAAAALGVPLDLLVAGAGCAAVAAEAARLAGVRRVLLCDAAHLANAMPEALAVLLVGLAEGYSHLLAAASSTGKSVMPRVAAKLDVAQVSEIVAVKAPDTFVRPIYAGSVLETVQSGDPVKVVTVRSTAFSAVGDGEATAPVEAVAAPPVEPRSRLLGRELAQSSRPELGAARVVVSGGRGLGSADGFQRLLEPLADRLSAALGASRAAVDAGYVGNELQVGQTGKVVAPELYVAVGLSGAIQHLAGMKDSRVIVAINRDAEAPIFQVADYGLVGDLFELVPALTAALGPSGEEG